jgi:hypothetical protein
VTVSNLDLQACQGTKLRIRLINGSSQEIPLGPLPQATVLEVSLPVTAPIQNVSDPGQLGLRYLAGDGTAISSSLLASSTINVSGTSVYDGSTLSPANGDVTFYIDPSAATVNIDGQQVRRTTVETIQ